MIQVATKPRALSEAKPGIIEAGAVYTLPEFQARMGMSKWAMRSARRNGLKVRRVGKRGYILGKDAIAFIEAAGE